MTHHPQISERDEDGADLVDLFSTTMAGLDTRTQVMADDALRHGRPLRRRRILASIAGGTAAVALCGGLGPFGRTTLSASPNQTVVPAEPVSAAPTPTLSRAPTPTAVSATGLSARVAALYLTRLAPGGIVSEYTGQQAADELFVGAQIDLGEGEVRLEINVQSNFFGAPGSGSQADVQEFYRCQRDADVGTTYSNWDVVRNDDGSILMTYTEPIKGTAKGRGVIADFLRTTAPGWSCTRATCPTSSTAASPAAASRWPRPGASPPTRSGTSTRRRARPTWPRPGAWSRPGGCS